MPITRHLNEAQAEAVANADAHTSNAALPTYTELYALAQRLAYPDAGEALLLEDYRNIARNVIEFDRKIEACHGIGAKP